jgi:arylsulfatase
VNNEELYDIQADPGETANVIDRYPEVVAQMRAAYDAWWAKTWPLMVNEEVPLAQERPFWMLYERQLNSQGIPKWEAPQL